MWPCMLSSRRASIGTHCGVGERGMRVYLKRSGSTRDRKRCETVDRAFRGVEVELVSVMLGSCEKW